MIALFFSLLAFGGPDIRPATPAEAKELADFAYHALSAGEGAALSARLLPDAVCTPTVQGLELDEAVRHGVVQGCRAAVQNNQMAEQFLQNGYAIEGARIVQGKDGPRVLLRFDAADSSLLMVELEPVVVDGKTGFANLVNLANGVDLQSSFRQMSEWSAAHGPEVALQQIMQLRDAMQVIRVEKDGARGLAMLDKLPENVVADILVGILRVEAATLVGDEKLIEEARRFEERWPDPGVASLVLYNGYLASEQPARAIAAASALRGRTQDDPALLSLLGGAHMWAGEVEAAEKLLVRSLEGDAELAHTRVHLADVRIIQGRFEDAIALIEPVRARGNRELPDYANTEGYETFVASKAYRKWVKAH